MKPTPEVAVTLTAALWDRLRREAARLLLPALMVAAVTTVAVFPGPEQVGAACDRVASWCSPHGPPSPSPHEARDRPPGSGPPAGVDHRGRDPGDGPLRIQSTWDVR